jgi:succinylglutamic semialdehyde dehydrogenase
MTLFSSKNPATDVIIWQGTEATSQEIEQAIRQAEVSQKSFRKMPFAERALIAKRFAALLDDTFAELISKEMGKPLWESKGEVEAMKRKVDISIDAYQERCPTRCQDGAGYTHKPHGVVAVFGAFNFPGHLPNGHIVPALLAGNSVIFKPSELTPAVGIAMKNLWKEAGLPDAVFQLLQGGKEVGKQIVANRLIRGLFFTGSAPVGRSILETSLAYPERIVALEMGGNNPLIVSSCTNSEAATYVTIQSAYLTSGQRCSCSRRLIVIRNATTQRFLDSLIHTTKNLMIAPYTTRPEPYMGPVVNATAAHTIMKQYEALKKAGGKPLLEMKRFDEEGAFLSPALIDVTGCSVPDVEIFGPVLQLTFVQDLDEAIIEANRTSYGLCAGIISDSRHEYERVLDEVRAGVVNWNTPTTGASSHAPFGGIGQSGNFRPSAYYAADYTAYPVAFISKETAVLPTTLPPGFPPCMK